MNEDGNSTHTRYKVQAHLYILGLEWCGKADDTWQGIWEIQ